MKEALDTRILSGKTLIVVAEDISYGPNDRSSQKHFSLWFLHTSFDILPLWCSGVSIRNSLDYLSRQGRFYSKSSWDKASHSYGMETGEFVISKEFCQIKGIEHFPKFWEDITNMLMAKRIWIHKDCRLKGVI